MDGSDSSVEVVRSQHIKDVKLALEYKYLIKAAPTGIYLLPEFDNIRILHGVIFVRRGIYRDGVFRFRIDLPKAYNDVNTFPLVTFTPPIFNPLVDLSTGKLDYGADELFREWNPEKHHLVTLITFIKKIFFLKSYSEFSRVANKQASDL
jgi:ubiquitin-protein ligase